MTGQRFHLGLRTLQNTSRTLESNAKFLHVLTWALSMATLHWIPAAVVFSVAKITDHDAAVETNAQFTPPARHDNIHVVLTVSCKTV